MSCNGCYNSFSLLRAERGCPSCGFSYCSKCLGHKVYLPRLQAEKKVCHRCKTASMSNDTMKKDEITAPDAFYKRMVDGSALTENSGNVNAISSPLDAQMYERLSKLKEKNAVDPEMKRGGTDAEIAERLQKIKGNVPVVSDAELHARLAKLRGVPVIESKPALMTKDLRTEQEQVEDLMKQYLENTAIDCKYNDQFDSVINDMEGRLQRLKDAKAAPGASGTQRVPLSNVSAQMSESEDEEDTVKKIIEKLKAEALLEDEGRQPSTNDELPFCEICNEDANMRCLGCKYLFCKRCFTDHKDDDDGCDKYEPYEPPKGSSE